MKEKNRFSLIGAGNIAHSLVPALIKSGFTIDSIISRNLNSAKILSEKNKIINYSDNLKDISRESDYYIIAVNDNQISDVSDKLSRIELQFENKIFVHLSGSKNIEVLRSIANKGGNTVSVHFMKSFPNHNLQSFDGSFAAVETKNNNLFEQIKEVLIKLNTFPFRISSEKKILYHLMGVFALNFISSNYYNAEQIKKQLDDKIPPLPKLFNPSIKSVLENYHTEKNLYNSLSGTIKREEYEIVKEHLAALKEINNHNLYLTFIANSLSIISLIKEEKKNLSRELLNIKSLLIEHLENINKTKL